MNVPALMAANLTKSYGRYAVIDDLTLRLPASSLVGLIGPNGAGKTTLVRLLAGLITPDSGSIRLGGYDLRTDEVAARSCLAYVPDVPNLYPELTAYEHLELVARAHQTMSTFDADAEVILRRFGLWEARDSPAYALSRGMVQKLSICGAFIRPSSVMLMDEPGGSLDIDSLLELHDLLGAYREAGGMALLSSHQWETLQAICDRFVLLRPGRALEGGLDHLREMTGASAHATLRDVYLAFMR